MNNGKRIVSSVVYAFSFSSFRKAVKEYAEIIEKIEESRKNQEIDFKRGLR